MKKSICLTCLLLLFSAVSIFAGEQTAKINVATYNIRQYNQWDSTNGNGWAVRAPYVGSLIRFHQFDIFGTQEGFKFQLDDLLNFLPGYAYIGVGRDDGKEEGEHSAIFYRTDLFELLDSGDFWLSETPDRPGLGWDAACVRICTWGKFRHKPSDKEFLFFNLHMDHVGTQARIESAKLVRKKIAEIGKGATAFVTGDFNVDQTHNSYATMTENNELKDSFTTADFVYAPNGTFNSYQTDGFTTSRIDHIFVTPDVVVDQYGVLTDTYRSPLTDSDIKTHDAPAELKMKKFMARVPSDHFPVMIRCEIK